MIKIANGIKSAVFAAVFLTACASAPTWEGLSEAEIGDWKTLGINAEQAQTYHKATLDPAAVKQWQDNNIGSLDDILRWHGDGFAPDEAKGWVEAGFATEEATDWKASSFSSTDAGAWKTGGFSLKDATKNRDKGLTPIQ